MATEYDTARTQYDGYRWAYDNGHSDWLVKASRCFDFWRSKQWRPEDLAELKRAGRPALTLNVVESLVRAMKGIQRALRHDVRFTPVYGADAESAAVQDAVWLHTQNQNALDFMETEVYEKGLIMGRAYYDVRVSHDESLQGHVVIRSPRSQDIVLDPSADQYDTTTWPQVISRRWVSYQDLVNLWGKEKADQIGQSTSPVWMDYEDQFLAHQMGRMPYYYNGAIADTSLVRAYLLLDRQYHVVKNKDVFVDTQTGDTSEIPETWERERIGRVLEQTPGLGTMKRKVKTVRWTVTSDHTVLHDEDSPYKFFTTVPFFPSFIDGVDKGIVEDLLDPQELYNKVTSQELHIINTTANSGWKVKKGALKNMTIEELEKVGSKSGFVAELDDIAAMEKIQPNQVPAGHDRLSFKADAVMRSLSGVSNQSRGFAREDVASEAIELNQAAQDINFAGWLSNLHRSKMMLATRVQDCVQTHYTETRVLLINKGSVYKPEIETLTINQPSPEGAMLNDVTKGRYSTVLVPAPSRTTLGEADFKLLLMMREKLGIAIPDAMLIELSPATNKAQLIQALQGDSNERQRAQEQAEQQAAQVEAQKQLAMAKKEEAAAMLNQARAEKFAVEAASDPDASYERVETTRITAEQDMAANKLRLDERKAEDTKRYQDKQIALRLAELDQDRELAEAKAKQDGASLRRDKKPGKTRK